MSEANRQLIRRWFEEVWNQKSAVAIDEMFSAEGKAHGFPDADSFIVGPAAFKLIHETYIGAFPDLRFTLLDVFAEDDSAAVRWTMEATHTGGHLGIAPTSRRITHHGASFVHIRNNQIVEGWNEMDMNNLFQQLH
jgi:predicted ester cyclase